jgi:hypothetical protein
MSRNKMGWIALAALAGAGASAALAQETGMSDLHAQRLERGLICMTEHFHYGTSGAQPTRKAAEAEAIASWAGFTAWEYGDPWGNYRIAASRAMKCAQSGAEWTCETEARPCRRPAAAGPKRSGKK